MRILTKGEFVERMSKKTLITKTDCKKFLAALDELVRQCLVDDEAVKLGFVSLEPKEVPTKQAKNPMTGEDITVKAHRSVRVIVSSSLKATLKK